VITMTAAIIIQGLASVYIFFVSTMALNRMTSKTRHAVRYSHVALIIGSAAGIASGFVARDIFECIFAVGVALYLAANQRAGDRS
jgi:hypothetical protein